MCPFPLHLFLSKQMIHSFNVSLEEIKNKEKGRVASFYFFLGVTFVQTLTLNRYIEKERYTQLSFCLLC